MSPISKSNTKPPCRRLAALAVLMAQPASTVAAAAAGNEPVRLYKRADTTTLAVAFSIFGVILIALFLGWLLLRKKAPSREAKLEAALPHRMSQDSDTCSLHVNSLRDGRDTYRYPLPHSATSSTIASSTTPPAMADLGSSVLQTPPSQYNFERSATPKSSFSWSKPQSRYDSPTLHSMTGGGGDGFKTPVIREKSVRSEEEEEEEEDSSSLSGESSVTTPPTSAMREKRMFWKQHERRSSLSLLPSLPVRETQQYESDDRNTGSESDEGEKKALIVETQSTVTPPARSQDRGRRHLWNDYNSNNDENNNSTRMEDSRSDSSPPAGHGAGYSRPKVRGPRESPNW